MAHVITILAEGFEETEAVTVIDLLRRASIKVTILGLESLEIKGAHDITFKADMLLSEFNQTHNGLVLPGGMPGTLNLANSPAVIGLIQNSFSKGLLCAAICAAPSVLGKAGILKGKKATCYPGFEEKLTGAHHIEDSVVRDDTIITSRGVNTAIPFGLELITYLKDKKTSQEISSAILYK